MVRMSRLPGLAVKRLFLALVWAALGTNAAYSQETPRPKKNSWVFSADRTTKPGWLYVTIKPQGDIWVISSLDRRAPAEIAKESPLEPFIVSPDFQQWSNYYTDNIGNCGSFAMRDSPLKSVCSSALNGKNRNKTGVGRLFSNASSGRYDADQVNAAINAIDPADALPLLEAIEHTGTR